MRNKPRGEYELMIIVINTKKGVLDLKEIMTMERGMFNVGDTAFQFCSFRSTAADENDNIIATFTFFERKSYTLLDCSMFRYYDLKDIFKFSREEEPEGLNPFYH